MALVSPPRFGRRPVLSRAQVVAAAVGLIDDVGLHGFSMRSVGDRLRVQPMALYPYVGSREGLLDGIVEFVLAEVVSDADLHPEEDPRWQGFLTRSAHEIRRIALAHPEIFPLVATRPPDAPWVRPPLRSLPWMESFLSTLVGFGFSDAAMVATYRAFASFLLGHLLLEVAAIGVSAGPVELDSAGPPVAVPEDVLQGFPHLQTLQSEMMVDRSTALFAAELATLVGRLEPKLGASGHRT